MFSGMGILLESEDKQSRAVRGQSQRERVGFRQRVNFEDGAWSICFHWVCESLNVKVSRPNKKNRSF